MDEAQLWTPDLSPFWQALKDYQQRKSDIYQALAIQHELHPLYSSELHGFIEFLKLKPELIHGYLDFFSPYLSKVCF